MKIHDNNILTLYRALSTTLIYDLTHTERYLYQTDTWPTITNSIWAITWWNSMMESYKIVSLWYKVIQHISITYILSLDSNAALPDLNRYVTYFHRIWPVVLVKRPKYVRLIKKLKYDITLQIYCNRPDQ